MERRHFGYIIHQNIVDAMDILVNFVIEHVRSVSSPTPITDSTASPSRMIQNHGKFAGDVSRVNGTVVGYSVFMF